MRSRLIAAAVVSVLASEMAFAQIYTDVLGAHNMSPASGSPITGNLGSPCLYCHAPHSGIEGTGGVSGTPLWSQKLSSVQSYQTYTSITMVNKTNASPPLGSNSTLCLSCHDGTVALGTLTPYGQVSMSGTLAGTAADLGTNLQSTHPFNFVTPLQPAPDIWPSLGASPPSTQDTTGVVRLINGNVECGSCHNPHVQNIDSSSDFLVIDNSQSALCLACHNTVPSGTGMGLAASVARPATAAGVTSNSTSKTASVNPLARWRESIHATATNRVASQISPEAVGLVSKRMTRVGALGPYTNLRKNGCLSCHATHNSSTKVLLRALDDQTCIVCHSGGTSVSPPAPNIAAEMASPKISHVIAGGCEKQFALGARERVAESQSPCRLRGLPQSPCHETGRLEFSRASANTSVAGGGEWHQRHRRPQYCLSRHESIRELPALPWNECGQIRERGGVWVSAQPVGLGAGSLERDPAIRVDIHVKPSRDT